MPGWTAPFSTNLNMRGFADRTIQEQTPSHLARSRPAGSATTATCPTRATRSSTRWPLCSRPHTATHDAACACAAEIYAAYGAAFERLARRAHGDPRPARRDRRGAGGDVRRRRRPDRRGVRRGDRRRRADAARRPCSSSTSSTIARARVPVRAVRGRLVRVGRCRRGHRLDARSTFRTPCVEILSAGVTTPDVDHETLCTCAATILADVRHALPRVDGRPSSPPARRSTSSPTSTRRRSGAVRRAHLRRGRRRRRSGPAEAALRHVHRGVVPPPRARARPRRTAQHLPASDPPRLRRGLRLQPRPARTDGTREQLT